VVRLIGTPGGITPPGAERRVFRLAVIVGAVLIVATVIFMLWQDLHPVVHPTQHFPVPQSK
jgi:fumarate reductase subunit D